MNTQLPEYKIIKNDNGEETLELLETTKPLKLDHIPISCTFAKLGKNLIIDPGLKEELIQDTRLTLSFTEDNKICATQKGETGTFTIDEIKKCIDIAEERSKEIRNSLDKVSDPKGNPWSEDIV
jgi:exosome complex component RRP42